MHTLPPAVWELVEGSLELLWLNRLQLLDNGNLQLSDTLEGDSTQLLLDSREQPIVQRGHVRGVRGVFQDHCFGPGKSFEAVIRSVG